MYINVLFRLILLLIICLTKLSYSPKSWLIFRRCHSKQSREKVYFLSKSSLWDMFKVLLFLGPISRQDSLGIFGLFWGRKWFVFLEGRLRSAWPYWKGEICIFVSPSMQKWCLNPVWYCWEVKWKSRSWGSLYGMPKLRMLTSGCNCNLCLCYLDVCDFHWSGKHC